MANVIFAPRKRPDGSLAKQTYAFLQKLWEDDTLPGLHIEPINNCVDPKARTGRVNDNFRAVLFKIQPPGGETHYVFTGVWPHDEAIKLAQSATLKTNPVNGLPELIIAAEGALPAAAQPQGRVTLHATPEPPQPWLSEINPGITLVELTDELGIEPGLAERALAARSDDEILALAEAASVEWQGLALLDLAAGMAVAQVRETLGHDETEQGEREAADEERLLAGLRAPAARMQFAWLEDEAELREVIEEGDFARWRTFLHPEQRRYAERGYNGPFRLTGGAGTGKTVVLLHRARMLARRDPAVRVVLTTFTRNLAASLAQNLAFLDGSLPHAKSLGEPGVLVTGVDAAAHAVLQVASPDALARAVAAVLGPGGNRAGGRTANPRELWIEAAASVDALPTDLCSPTFLATEYVHVVLPARLTSAEEYLRVRRTGRGVPLSRRQRGAVWKTIAAYRSLAAARGALDFGEVCAVAAELGEAGEARAADHVLVDEGQDLTPPQWQFLRSLVAEGRDDLFIAEDSQQRIYGQPVVLGRYGIRIVGRSRRLSLNYRTTEQVLRFACGVLGGVHFADLEDNAVDAAGYRSARSGPAPTTIALSSLSDELARAADQVREWLQAGVEPHTIGVFARDQRTVDLVSRGLDDRGVAVRQVTRGAASAGYAQLMTMHRAKGMEFSRVLIVGADAALLPASYLLKSVPDGERADLLQRERSLFYVAATRARDELVVLWEGQGSEYLPTRTSVGAA